MLLSELKPGQLCIVKKLLGETTLKQRLITMGIVPGVQITLQKYAPLGDPLEIKVKNFNLSLRKKEAQTIMVTALNCS